MAQTSCIGNGPLMLVLGSLRNVNSVTQALQKQSSGFRGAKHWNEIFPCCARSFALGAHFLRHWHSDVGTQGCHKTETHVIRGGAGMTEIWRHTGASGRMRACEQHVGRDERRCLQLQRWASVDLALAKKFGLDEEGLSSECPGAWMKEEGVGDPLAGSCRRDSSPSGVLCESVSILPSLEPLSLSL